MRSATASARYLSVLLVTIVMLGVMFLGAHCDDVLHRRCASSVPHVALPGVRWQLVDHRMGAAAGGAQMAQNTSRDLTPTELRWELLTTGSWLKGHYWKSRPVERSRCLVIV